MTSMHMLLKCQGQPRLKAIEFYRVICNRMKGEARYMNYQNTFLSVPTGADVRYVPSHLPRMHSEDTLAAALSSVVSAHTAGTCIHKPFLDYPFRCHLAPAIYHNAMPASASYHIYLPVTGSVIVGSSRFSCWSCIVLRACI